MRFFGPHSESSEDSASSLNSKSSSALSLKCSTPLELSCPRVTATSARDDSFWDSWQLSVVHHCDAHHQRLADEHGLHDEEAVNTITTKLAHAAEIEVLEEQAAKSAIRCKEATAQRAILESVISERLVTERAAITEASKLRSKLSETCSELYGLRSEQDQKQEAMRHVQSLAESWERRAKDLEVQVAEVESFLGGDGGTKVLQLEADLAEARLALAEAESEKDDLQMEIELLKVQAGAHEQTDVMIDNHSVIDGDHSAVFNDDSSARKNILREANGNISISGALQKRDFSINIGATAVATAGNENMPYR